jgi:hypothetical protein
MGIQKRLRINANANVSNQVVVRVTANAINLAYNVESIAVVLLAKIFYLLSILRKFQYNDTDIDMILGLNQSYKVINDFG